MKKKFLVFLLAALLFVCPVIAAETDCIGGPEGTDCVSTIEESAFKAGDSVTYNKEVLGSAFIAGNIASFGGNSDGVLFIAGNSVDVKGEAEYALIAGNTITASGRVIKDSFIAGNILNIKADIGRDLYAVGSSVTLTGVIDRNVYIGAETVNLEDVEIMGDATIYGDRIIIGKGVEISGTLKYTEGKATIDSSAKVGALETVEVNDYSTIKVNPIIVTLKAKAWSYLSILLVFVLMAVFTPILFRGVGKDELSFLQIVTYIGYALVYLILVPMAAIMLMFLVIGIPLAFIALIVYGLTIYLAKAYMGYYIGRKIFASRKEENALVEGLVGITILYVVSLIPYVGPFVSFLACLCGIGIMLFTVYKNTFKMKK